MRANPPGKSVVLASAIWLIGMTVPAGAQNVEIMPFGGYRFGGDFFELVSQHPVDLDGAPALGFVLNVPLYNGMQFEGLFTHQQAHVSIPAQPFDPATRWHITVDHLQGGGLQEFATGRVRPFLTGVLGLTRYAAEGENEVRFTVGAGGGVKLFPLTHVGLRLDGRLYTTFVDADATVLACSPGACIAAVNVDLVWQAEFTAGIVFRIP